MELLIINYDHNVDSLVLYLENGRWHEFARTKEEQSFMQLLSTSTLANYDKDGFIAFLVKYRNYFNVDFDRIILNTYYDNAIGNDYYDPNDPSWQTFFTKEDTNINVLVFYEQLDKELSNIIAKGRN